VFTVLNPEEQALAQKSDNIFPQILLTSEVDTDGVNSHPACPAAEAIRRSS